MAPQVSVVSGALELLCPTLSVCMQGLVECGGCREGCFHCAPPPRHAATVFCWNTGEVFGAANPTLLPAPTTNSHSRIVLVWAAVGTFSKLDIVDAERAQGLPPDYTLVAGSQLATKARRFQCAGTALPGQVSSPV